MTEIKERIKQGLEMRNMKQAELAEKTGIDKGQISSYISGKYKPKQENLSLMAVALNVSDYWLMGLDVPFERYEMKSTDKQMERVAAYAKVFYEKRELDTTMKLYEQLSEENRRRVRVYMERLLAVQKLEEEVG